MLSFGDVIHIKVVNGLFYILCLCIVIEIQCAPLRAHLNSDVNFSSEIFGLYLDCTQFIAEKVHSQTQVIPNILNFSNNWSNHFQSYAN